MPREAPVTRAVFPERSLMIVSPDRWVDSETECGEAPYSDKNIETWRTKRRGSGHQARPRRRQDGDGHVPGRLHARASVMPAYAKNLLSSYAVFCVQKNKRASM